MSLDLGKILLRRGVITIEQLKRGRRLEDTTGDSLALCLQQQGSITEDKILDAVSHECSVPAIKLNDFTFDEELVRLVPLELVRRHRVFPLSKKGHTLTIVTADPTDILALDDIKFSTGLSVSVAVSTESAIRAAIKRLYGEEEHRSAAMLESVGEPLDLSEENKEDASRDLGDLTSPVANSPSIPPSPTKEAPNGYFIFKVFYATDRQSTGEQAPSKYYGCMRNTKGCLTFGTCEVSIPRDHKLARIERPSWQNLFREDPARHVVLLGINPLSLQDYFQGVSADVGLSTKRQILIFIHGFDVTFEQGAWRTAQLAYDLGFDGPPILYSWPSRGHLRDYTADEATMEWSVAHLKQFLSDVCTRCGAQMVHVIAHSMGNRILVNALKEIALADTPNASPLLHEVVLTAPDIDKGVFLQTADLIQKAARRITLYASSKDKALEASKKIHGGPRAGDSGKDIIAIPDIETIDASQVDTSFIGHSYYGDNRSVLSDLFYLLRDGLPAGKRFGMRRMALLNRLYWAFVP